MHALCSDSIQANQSAAGMTLQADQKSLRALWGEPDTIEQIHADHVRLEYSCASFWFEADELTQIGLHRSYTGKTKEGIGIGSSKKEVESVYGMLDWDGTWRVDGPPFGLGFDFDSYINGTSCVSAIYVFLE